MLRNIIETQLVTCDVDTEIPIIAKLMEKESVGSVLVCDADRKPVGLITDRDIVIRCISEDKDPKSCQASDVMTQSLECAKATDGIFDVISLMKKAKVRRIPVVDENGIAIGIISHGDLISLLGRELHDLSEATTAFSDDLEQKAA